MMGDFLEGHNSNGTVGSSLVLSLGGSKKDQGTRQTLQEVADSYREYCRALEEEQDTMIHHLKAEILRVRLERDFARKRHLEECLKLRERIALIKRRLEQQRLDYKSEVSVHKYVKYMKSNSNNTSNNDGAATQQQPMPSYIYILQAKVLRDLHQFCIVDHQMVFCQEHAQEMVAHVQRSCRLLGEERMEVERDLLTRMVMMQGLTEELRNSYTEQLAEMNEEKDVLFDRILEARQQRQSEIDDLLNKISQVKFGDDMDTVDKTVSTARPGYYNKTLEKSQRSAYSASLETCSTEDLSANSSFADDGALSYDESRLPWTITTTTTL